MTTKLQHLSKNSNNYNLVQEKLLLVEQHQIYNNNQKAKFKELQINLQQGHILAVIDFKENLYLNIGPEEEGHDYYNKSQRAYFSFAIYYKNAINKLTSYFFDLISDNLTKDD